MKFANGYVLPADKLKQRELAFAIYRDMGIKRSMIRLVTEFAKEHPVSWTPRMRQLAKVEPCA